MRSAGAEEEAAGRKPSVRRKVRLRKVIRRNEAVVAAVLSDPVPEMMDKA
jgi:hypothetical protein